MKNPTTIFVLALICWTTIARNGLDISTGVTDATFSCYSQAGHQFLIVQGYQGYGGLNTAALQNLKLAKNRGFDTDIYMANCPGKDAYSQVSEMMDSLTPDLYKRVWIRVENNYNPGCSWSSNSPQKNCQYLRSLVNGIQARGAEVGIFSSPAFWKAAFQDLTHCPEVSSLPLWYGADDGSASFSGFSAFGGWVTPNLKMYSYGNVVCGTNVNLNWKP